MNNASYEKMSSLWKKLSDLLLDMSALVNSSVDILSVLFKQWCSPLWPASEPKVLAIYTILCCSDLLGRECLFRYELLSGAHNSSQTWLSGTLFIHSVLVDWRNSAMGCLYDRGWCLLAWIYFYLDVEISCYSLLLLLRYSLCFRNRHCTRFSKTLLVFFHMICHTFAHCGNCQL